MESIRIAYKDVPRKQYTGIWEVAVPRPDGSEQALAAITHLRTPEPGAASPNELQLTT